MDDEVKIKAPKKRKKADKPDAPKAFKTKPKPKPKPKPLPELDMQEVHKYAHKVVFGLIRKKTLTGRQKHQQAVKEVSAFIDSKLKFGDGLVGSVAEALDGPLARVLVGAVVKQVHTEMFK